MGRRAKHWFQVATDSGIPGLCIVVGGCVFVTLKTAQTVDSDEAMQIIIVTFLGTMVAAYRMWSANRKRSD